MRVNERIRAREIRLIDQDGEQVGVVAPEEGRSRANEQGLDLVEVAPNARPPVCRIMDYGKYKYEQKKKAQAGKAKKKGRATTLKEIKMRPNTDDHDLEFKLKKARDFLLEGDKLKVTVMFRGREMAHRNVGYQQLEKVKQLLGEIAQVENPPQLMGRFLSMIMVPSREAVAEAKKLRDEEERRAAAQAGESGGTGDDGGSGETGAHDGSAAQQS